MGSSSAPVSARARASKPSGPPTAAIAGRVVAALLLTLLAPLLLALGLAVRLGSHGPVLERETVRARSGRVYEQLVFRTGPDGAHTDAHARVRAVFGAADDVPLTGAGRMLRMLHLRRLPRLLTVVSGGAPLV